VKCYTHSEREAVGVCVNCGKALCTECLRLLTGGSYCHNCGTVSKSSKDDYSAIEGVKRQEVKEQYRSSEHRGCPRQELPWSLR
jgi:hypothetical protein